MNVMNAQPLVTAASILDEVRALKARVLEKSGDLLAAWNLSGADAGEAVANLAHYMAIRSIDVRPLQRELMALGLSSLGRLESRVLPTLDAVIAALSAICGQPAESMQPDPDTFFAGEARLTAATDELFGQPPAHRRSRIMVTIPGEAAADPALLLDLVRCGMDVARINCAHDNADTWRLLARELRNAGAKMGRPITIHMDIAGPKIRTDKVLHADGTKHIDAGGQFLLTVDDRLRLTDDIAFAVSLSLPEIIERLTIGDRIGYDDGKMEGFVEKIADGEAVVRITHAKPGGIKLKAEKGINLPDTDLGLSPLTKKDEEDLKTVLECADIIGYSFVRRPEDIELLDKAIERAGYASKKPGLIAKIERPEAVKSLPALIARASPGRRFGVMIARGDLAAEIGFERVAEMQEEILWVCEAAGVPVVWATQVLEDLVRDGLPSRGEMTDAAMAVRAECVMLNKGPSIREGVMTLDRLLTRMEGHMLKKTPTLRALKTWS